MTTVVIKMLDKHVTLFNITLSQYSTSIHNSVAMYWYVEHKPCVIMYYSSQLVFCKYTWCLLTCKSHSHFLCNQHTIYHISMILVLYCMYIHGGQYSYTYTSSGHQGGLPHEYTSQLACRCTCALHINMGVASRMFLYASKATELYRHLQLGVAVDHQSTS